MVSILKNQLLKHLSRYTKNLSPDKVNLSTFRGEGELSNLQLDENVLTELLELPSWLRLTSAWCNHVSFRISWTKLKSTPITLTLDEVKITVETCEIARSGTQTAGISSLAVPQGKYSFIHKVVDGITVLVNTVNVNLISPAFTASVQISKIRVESRTPKWLLGDLRVTRIKDPVRGLILIFKELSWQTIRIEASSTQDKSLTPLRLLTNQARCRITIKKKLSDCSILASRLVLILDDLLWVLTDSQLKAVLHFVDSLSGLIKASTNVVQRVKAQRKLETLPEYQAQLAQSSKAPDAQQLNAVQRFFNIYDVRETSYHFFSQRIDLHLCDDAGVGRSSYPSLKDGGALQISLQGFQIDYYPYHLAKADRSHWPKYKEASVPPALWLEQSLNAFREAILNLSQPNRPPTHPSLERTTNLGQQQSHLPRNQATSGAQSSINSPNISQSAAASPMRKHVLDNISKLMCVCVIIKIEEFTLYRVTTSGNKQMPKEFITGDRDRYKLPPEMPSLHAEFTYFYYPGDFVFPLPPSKAFVHINPVQISFDLDSCLWFSSFVLNLHESLLRTTNVASSLNSPSTPSSGSHSEPQPNLMYMDVKVEVIMPRIVFEASANAPQQRDRPRTMVAQVTRLTLTNIREMGSSRADLAQAVSSLQEGSLVFGSGFPSMPGDLCIVTDRILSHIAAKDVIAPDPMMQGTQSAFSHLTRYAMWSEPRDVWCIKLDPVWVDFYGARSVGANRAIPFVDAVPVTIWLHGRSDFDLFAEEFDSEQWQYSGVNETNCKRYSNISDSTKSSESLVLSVSNLMQSQDLDPLSRNLHGNSTEEIALKRHSKGHMPLIGDNVKKKSAEVNYRSAIPCPPVDSEADKTASADLHVIAHVSNLVSVQIDHYQYLFLLRLAEELTELATFLSLDSKRILQAANVEKSIIVGCVIPQVEISLVMPSQTPGKESSGGDGESVLPDSASLGSGWPNSMDQTRNSNIFSSTECPSPVAVEVPVEIEHHPVPNTHGHNVQIRSAPTTSSSSGVASVENRSSSPVAELQMAAPEVIKTRNYSTTDSSSFSKEIHSGYASMKKGFSQFMTSIDSKLKTNTPEDVSDTLSVQSDISSDLENYLPMLGDSEKTADCMDVMFKLNPFNSDSTIKVAPIEVASEVCEDPYLTNMSSPSEPSEASSLRRRDLVSMVTFRLTTVEVIRQNIGNISAIRLQVSAVSCDECGAIPWDEFQNGQQKTKTKFGARCRAWNIAPHNPEAPPCIAVRLEEELTLPADSLNITDKKSIQSWFQRKLNVEVKNLNLQLSMSTVIGLGDLAEDEVIPTPIPMEVILQNVKVNLIEDRPPVNITSPGTLPVNLSIGRMYITRDAAGVFYLQPLESQDEGAGDSQKPAPKKDRDREVLSLQLVMHQLKKDNDNLRKQLTSSEKEAEMNKLKARQEFETLQSYLNDAQDDVRTLMDEKRTLMDTIRSLQDQLTTLSDVHMNATDGKR